MERGDFAIVFPDLIHHYQVFSKGENEVYQFYASLELSGPFMSLLQKKCPENPVIARAELHEEVKNALECLIKDKKVSGLWDRLIYRLYYTGAGKTWKTLSVRFWGIPGQRKDPG